MVDNLKLRGIELGGFRDVPTLKEQVDRLKDVEMTQVEMIEVYYKLIPIEERKRIDSLEMMDEFEEFELHLQMKININI